MRAEDAVFVYLPVNGYYRGDRSDRSDQVENHGSGGDPSSPDNASLLRWLVGLDNAPSPQEYRGPWQQLIAQLAEISATTADPSDDTPTDAGINTTRTSAKRLYSPSPLIAIVPAEVALITDVAVPSAKPQHIQAAVPHLLEEWTASDIDDLHIATGERDGTGAVPVIAIERDQLKLWLNQLRQTETIYSHALVDALLLPWQAGSITLLLDGKRVLLRWGEHRAGASLTDDLPLLLERLLQPGDASQPMTTHCQCLLVSNATTPHALVLTELCALLTTLGISPSTTNLDTTLLVYLATQFRQAEPASGATLINLLQGDFAPPQRYPLWQRWRPTAITIAACVAVVVLFNLMAGGVLNHQANTAQAQSEALYRELFPKDRRIVNLQQQLQNHLDTSANGGHSPFLILFSYLAKEIKDTPSEHPLQVRSLIFDAGSGTLQAELSAPAVDSLDAIQKRLDAEHIPTRILSVATDRDTVIGRLSLRDE